MELQEQIQKIDKWEWYLTQAPNWLADKLEKRFGTEVTARKLVGVRRKMRNSGKLTYGE